MENLEVSNKQSLDVSRFGLSVDLDDSDDTSLSEGLSGLSNDEAEADDESDSREEDASEDEVDEVDEDSDDSDEEAEEEDEEEEEDSDGDDESASDEWKRKFEAAEKTARKFQSEHDSLTSENQNLRHQMQQFALEFQRYQQEQQQQAKELEKDISDDDYYEGTKVKKLVKAKADEVNAVKNQLAQLQIARGQWLTKQGEFQEVNQFFIENRNKFQGIPTDEVGLYMAAKVHMLNDQMEKMKKEHEKELKKIKRGTKRKGGVPPTGTSKGRGGPRSGANPSSATGFIDNWNDYFKQKGFLD